MQRVTLSLDPDIGRYGAEMEIDLTEGTTLHTTVERSRGNPENPLSWADLKSKFEGLVTPVLGDDSETLYDDLRGFDQKGALAQVLELLSARR